VLIVAGVIVCLILAGTYSAVTSLSIQDTAMEQTPDGPQVQILSPQNDTTYLVNDDIVLNITASDAVAKITYFLELDGEYTYKFETYVQGGLKMTLYEISTLSGDSNITYTEPTKFFRLYSGVHVLYVYAFDANGNVVDYQSITFTISTEIPKGHLTYQEYQEILCYFESEGLTIMPPGPKDKIFLFGDLFYFQSAEEFASAVKAKNISTISKWDNSPEITFQGFVYEGCLPTIFYLKVIIS